MRLSPSFQSRSVVTQETTHFGWLMRLDRRTFLTASLGLAAGASTTALLNRPKYQRNRGGCRAPEWRFSGPNPILTTSESTLQSGLELFP